MGGEATAQEDSGGNQLNTSEALRKLMVGRPAQQLAFGHIQGEPKLTQTLNQLRKEAAQLPGSLEKCKAIIHKPEEPNVSGPSQKRTNLPRGPITSAVSQLPAPQFERKLLASVSLPALCPYSSPS